MQLDGLPSTVTLPLAVTLTFDLLILKSNQKIYEPKYIRNQNRVQFPLMVFEIRCSQGFRDARTLTHSLTDRQTRLQNDYGTVFNGVEGMIIRDSCLLKFVKNARFKSYVKIRYLQHRKH